MGLLPAVIILITSAFSVPATPAHSIPYIKFSMLEYLTLFPHSCQGPKWHTWRSFSNFLDYENMGHILGMAEQLAERSLHPHQACGTCTAAWPADFALTQAETRFCAV